MTNGEIINEIASQLGNVYPVINSFNNSEEIPDGGILAVKIKSSVNLHHGTARDYQHSVTVSGQTLTAEDLTQQTINGMYDYVRGIIEGSGFHVTHCVGKVITGGSVYSDGETNNFDFDFDLYICED